MFSFYRVLILLIQTVASSTNDLQFTIL